MTIQQLKYVIGIAEAKSMNKAANELYVSQPCLSNTIRELEEEIHTSLFVRTNRGIRLTMEGEEFLSYARQIVALEEMIENRYLDEKPKKMKFSVSMQHYTFAVDAFINMVKAQEAPFYEFEVYETKTSEVIENVRNLRSEIGILYLSKFNRKILLKLFDEGELIYTPLFKCGVYVYLSRNHPLADETELTLEKLRDYPYLSFDQGIHNPLYFAEEVLRDKEYGRMIRVEDRATMLNLMIGLHGYTLCSGILSENLNGDQYKAVPLHTKETMEIGYIKRNDRLISNLGEVYIEVLKQYKDKAFLKDAEGGSGEGEFGKYI